MKYINLDLHPGQVNCIKSALKLAIIQLELTNQKEMTESYKNLIDIINKKEIETDE